MKSAVLEKPEKITATGRKKGLQPKSKIIAGVIIAFVIALICVALQYFNTSSINVSAHFSSVTEGKNPDGSPFDINEMLSDEVLEMASEKLAGKVDAKAIKKHLSVSDSTSTTDIANLKKKIMDGNTDYSFYPNVYTLTYSVVSDAIKREGILAVADAVFKQIFMPGKGKILESVAESYSEYYFEKYVAGNVAMELEWKDIDSLDYYNKASKTKDAVGKISRFILSKYNKNPEFVSTDGTGYGELHTEIEQIMSIDINNYMSFVIQNGVTSDKASLLRQFAFMENLNNETNTRHISAYEIAKDVIDFYDSDTTKVVFIPALDEKRTFYMNRTKIGIDYLIEKASSEKRLADDASYNAEKYRYLADCFTKSAPVSQELFEAADAMHTEVKEKINNFIEKAETIISEGSQADDHEIIELGNSYSNFDLISFAICGGKIFILLLLIGFLAVSLIGYIGELCGKKRMVGEE